MNVKRRFRIIIILLLVCGCNKQSESLQYNDSIITEDVDGYSRDMLIHNDTLFVVNEDEGLLIYKIGSDIEPNTIALISIYSDTTFYLDNTHNQGKGWNLSGILFSDKYNRIFILDKFSDSYYIDFTDNLNSNDLDYLYSGYNNEHQSKFTLNDQDEYLEIFSLIRNKSDFVTSDIVSIYKISWDEFGDPNGGIILDSLNYAATDIHYMKNKLLVSNTSEIQNEFRVYNRNNIETPFRLDTTIVTQNIPNALYSTGDTLFVGMGDHAGVNIYDLENMDNVEPFREFAAGFSVREIFLDPLSSRLLLSCGYQGVVVLELDGNMMEVDSWILNTSYAYAARNYMGNIIVATRKGLEIINLNNSQ